MKTAFSLGLALLAALPAQAQILRSEALTGALLGGAAGAVIGNNSGDLGHSTWKGAAIGAGAGLLIGEVVGHHRALHDVQVPRPRQAVWPRSTYRRPGSVHVGVTPVSSYVHVGYHPGYRYGGWHRGYGWPDRHVGVGRFHGWGHYRHGPFASTYYPRYEGFYPHASYGYYGYGSGAGNGLLLGALLGGVIGRHSGEFDHHGWRGAAWGAGAGWLLGTLADSRRTAATEEAVVVSPSAGVSVYPAAAPEVSTAAAPVFTERPAPAVRSSMSAANALFGR